MQSKKILQLTAIGLTTLILAACASVDKNGVTHEPTGTYAVSPFQSYQSDVSLTAEQLTAIRTYYFKFNSSQLIGVNLQAVQAQGAYLSTHPSQIILLEGNTDIRGSREYNIGLGWRRAQSVAHMLISQGVKASNIKMVSYGAENPAANGHTQEDYARNRRVNLVYCSDKNCDTVNTMGALRSDL